MMEYMYPTFLVELLVAECMLLAHRPRRPYFGVWILGGVPLLLVAVFAVCCLQELAGGAALVGAVGYMIVFLMTLAVLRISFEVPSKVLLFFGAGAYAFQNLCYRVATLLEITGVVWRLGEYIGYGWADLLVHLGSFAVILIPFYFFFVRKVRAQGMENLYSPSALMLSLVTLVVTVLLCSVTNVYWWMSYQLSIVNYCFAILANFFILWIQSGMLEKIALKSDLEAIKRLWQQDRRQYEIAKENIDLINIKCHDMKHKIMTLRGQTFSPQEAEEIEKCISVYDSKVLTGCEPIDVLLTEKMLLCNERGIHLSCMVDGAALNYMHDYDLYSLFGNILSNAIEAVQRLTDESKKVIDLTVKRSGGMVFITCSNYYEGKISFDDGLPVTSKEESAEHGFGLKSIRLLAKKYDGLLDFSCEDNIFLLKLVFPVRKTTDSDRLIA